MKMCVLASIIPSFSAGRHALHRPFACCQYRIDVVTDYYAAEWVTAACRRDAGMTCMRSDMAASQLYLEALPLFSQGLVSLPDHLPLLRELRLLERTPSRVGKEQVTHLKGCRE
jgi:hypothetical protein